MPRRPWLGRMALGACALAWGAGCTLLIDFQDVPPAGDGGADGSAPLGPPDVRVDAPSDVDGSTVDAGPDSRDAIANADACAGHKDGKYCGGDQIVWPASKDDLVVCKTGKVSLVKYCPNGQGCLGMLNGYPDECDECAKKVDGTYCGRDLPGWDLSNQNQRIRCQSGRVVGSVLCTTCKSAGTNAVCQ